MKHLIQYTIALTAVLLLSSCDSFTEVAEPQSQITSTAVFEEKSSANAALADIYSRIREEGVITGNSIGGTVLLANYCDDLQFYGTNVNTEQFAKHTLLPSNTYINTLWRSTYSHIYAVNAFLEGIRTSITITAEDRDRFIGEALFIRAYLHFYLVNMYGQIPYVTTTDYSVNTAIAKVSVPEVYNRMLNDLIDAKSLLPDTYPTPERVRPNNAVVTALLARLYLYTQDWQNANKNTTEVINNTLFSWQENPAAEFLKGNPSIIWALHPGIAGLNTRDAKSFVFTSGPPSRSSLSPNLMNAFEAGDLRKTLWVKKISTSTDSWYHANKYSKTTNTGTSVEYTILFRMAEMYLIRAESRAKLNDLDGAKDDINKIRRRVGLPNTPAVTQEEILSAVAKERRLEFFTEQGHRFFDLKRTRKADEVLSLIKPNWQPSHIVLPLPENELLLNDKLFPQNTGY